MDAVKQTAGRLGFEETDLQAGGLVQLCRTEQVIRPATCTMTKSQHCWVSSAQHRVQRDDDDQVNLIAEAEQV